MLVEGEGLYVRVQDEVLPAGGADWRLCVPVGQDQTARPRLLHQLLGLGEVEAGVDGAVDDLHGQRLEGSESLLVGDARLSEHHEVVGIVCPELQEVDDVTTPQCRVAREDHARLSVLRADSLVTERGETLQSASSHQSPVNKRLLGHIHFVVFAWTEPLRHDVGVGQGAVGHRGEEEHWYRGQPVHVHLVGETLEQIVDNTAGVAGNQNVAGGLESLTDYPTEVSYHGVRHLGGSVSEGGHDHHVRPLDVDLVHHLGVGGEGGAAGEVDDLLKAGGQDPVTGTQTVAGADWTDLQQTEDGGLLIEADHLDLGHAGLHHLLGVEFPPAVDVPDVTKRRRQL